jgi:hypothetical protein
MAAAAFGFDVEDDAIVFPRGLRRVLVRALAWHGWRAPSVASRVTVHVSSAGVRFVWGDAASERVV